MGAKKKKNMANRLAKMSDEERARYLQHRADIEEEARRRKEQLIATFMKNKLKKEEAFSRLNLSKINQYWHQILRKAKCNEMKEECEHMRKWIDRTLQLKNRTIDNLVQELDEAEEQYCTNLQAHLEFIDTIIAYHIDNIDKINKTYEEERDQLIDETDQEKFNIIENAANELVHLKTIAFGQRTQAKANIKKEYDYRRIQIEELVCGFRRELEDMSKERDRTSASIWREIAAVIKGYVHQTDKRRSHFAELERIDADSAVEVSLNQARINREEAIIDSENFFRRSGRLRCNAVENYANKQIKMYRLLEEHLEKLKLEFATLRVKRRKKIKELEEKIKFITKELLLRRTLLEKHLKWYDKKIIGITSKTNDVINSFETFKSKGEQILFLMQQCHKLETEEEQLMKLTKKNIDCSQESDITDTNDDSDNIAPSAQIAEDKRGEEIFDEEFLEEEVVEYLDQSDGEEESDGLSSEDILEENKSIDGVARITAMLKSAVTAAVKEDKGKVRKTLSCKDEYLKKSFRKESSSSSSVKSKHVLKTATFSFLPQIKPRSSSEGSIVRPKADVLFEKVAFPIVPLQRAKSGKSFIQYGKKLKNPINDDSKMEEGKPVASKVRSKTSFRSKSLQFKTLEPEDLLEVTYRTSTSKSSAISSKDKIIKEITISNSEFSVRKTKSAYSQRNSNRRGDKVRSQTVPPKVETNILGGQTAPEKTKFMKDTFEALQNLENFWDSYNNVYLDLEELRDERATLAAENKHLRGMIRAILEAAALNKTASNSRVSTRVGSRYTNILSSPFRGLAQTA